MGRKKKEKVTEDLRQNGTSEESQETVDQATASEESEEDQVGQLKDKYLRLFAEFDNYKKRTARERLDLIKTASEDLIGQLLPVLDDFDRAKENAAAGAQGESFSEGVNLVYNKLYTVLKAKGLQPMDLENKEFDPELHEAITKIPAPSEDQKGKIIDYIEKGYYLNDKIIRHAKVVIGE